MKSQSAARSAADDRTLGGPEPDATGDQDTTPAWVWVLVRGGANPGEGVWVRYQVEQAPEGLGMRPAEAPKDGSVGVVVLPHPKLLTRGEPTATPTLRPFLAKVREMAAERHGLLTQLRAALQGGRSDEALRIAHTLVGITG